MAIRTIVTRGYGNGTFNGTIGLVVTRGYTVSDVELAVRHTFAAKVRDFTFAAQARDFTFTLQDFNE